MISPLIKLAERAGPGGRLLLFFKLVCVYFLAAGGGEPSAWRLIVKCAPVLWLATFVSLAGGPPASARYRRRVLAALLWSAAGDALLLWEPLFVLGMLAFAAAHCCYLSALGFRPLRPALALVPALGVVMAVGFLRPPGALALAVPPYAALLACVAWRALARVRWPAGRAAWSRLSACVGAWMFLASDSLLGCDLFYAHVPHANLLVMSTYYVAQLGFALSVLDPAPDALLSHA